MPALCSWMVTCKQTPSSSYLTLHTATRAVHVPVHVFMSSLKPHLAGSHVPPPTRLQLTSRAHRSRNSSPPGKFLICHTSALFSGTHVADPCGGRTMTSDPPVCAVDEYSHIHPHCNPSLCLTYSERHTMSPACVIPHLHALHFRQSV